MWIRLVTVGRWRGYDRAGQPPAGYPTPDDETTHLALAEGWIEEVAEANPHLPADYAAKLEEAAAEAAPAKPAARHRRVKPKG